MAEDSEPPYKKTRLEDEVLEDSQSPGAVLSDPQHEKSESIASARPLSEREAGIIEYLGNHAGFKAIIKQRYSDFNVNEISQDGSVVHLTDMFVPVEEESVGEAEKKQEEETKCDAIESELLSKLETLVSNEDKSSVVNIPAPDSKDLRTKVHLFVKQSYPQLETKTEEINGQKMIQAFWKKGKKQDARRDEWPASKKSCRFVKFVLYKENKDTMDAINLISKLLKIKESVFQYAGTKDKRARTSQEITANRVHPQKLVFLNKLLRNMGVGNFRYVEEPLKLGQLLGNQFTIVLRNVEASNEAVDKALASLEKLGFVNYFGMQRFGTTSIPTHKIGCALLHQEWQKSVDLILMPRDDEPNKQKFQKIWQETRDATKTLQEVPRYCGLERNLLQGLERKMKPFNALERINRNTRMLYVHSYQALIWNQMVSKRLSKLGSKPVVGDLVLRRKNILEEKSEPAELEEADLASYTIHDVVLPLPGHSIKYPRNEVHDWYREVLKQDGLNIDDMKRPQKDYSLPGSYRHICVAPSDVSWLHFRYDDYTTPLTHSDWDVVKGESLSEPANKGKFKAVVLKMNLPTSCYATMALREVLKQDTSAAHQTTLNVGGT